MEEFAELVVDLVGAVAGADVFAEEGGVGLIAVHLGPGGVDELEDAVEVDDGYSLGGLLGDHGEAAEMLFVLFPGGDLFLGAGELVLEVFGVLFGFGRAAEVGGEVQDAKGDQQGQGGQGDDESDLEGGGVAGGGVGCGGGGEPGGDEEADLGGDGQSDGAADCEEEGLLGSRGYVVVHVDVPVRLCAALVTALTGRR